MSGDGGGGVREAVSGWGRHPVRVGRVARPERLAMPPGPARVVPRGLGRAYGDAALPGCEDDLVVETVRADRILAFDDAAGRLTCEAGLSVGEVIRVFLPRGWFPPVTPGTKLVTVGGCVASDVHGKNHHRDGSFGRFVEGVRLGLADGSEVECGPDRERELFLATVGGMGLTGLILEVTFRLARVESPWTVMETQRVGGLDEMLGALRASADWPYTVGWIDCLARGRALGRGLLMRGRHASRAETGGRPAPPPRRRRVPIDAPEWLLSPPLMRAFNAGYYWTRGRGSPRSRLVSHEQFFYPLDAILDWNRLYGRRGFLQYQCVLPRAGGSPPLRRVLEHLAAAGTASFLAVIKDCGPEGEAYLSFPMEGTTLALDLPYRGPRTETLIHELNALVLRDGGRIYLAKDAVTRAEDFERMTPRLRQWRAVRDRWDPKHRFRTAQSIRVLGDAP
jgi:FAD/FMN-containing dehydrogenase